MIYAKILAALLFSTALVFGAGSVPLKNAVLTSPLDGGGQSITNVVIPDYVSTNDPKYLAAITNVPENIATLDDVTNIVDSALEPYALTNHQHDASDITGSTWITDADTNGWETGSHADLVTDALEDLGGDTNAWHDYEYLRKDGDWINPFVNFMSVDQSRAILQTLGKTMELIATSTNGAPCVGTYTWNVTNLYEFGGTGSIGYWTSDGVTGGPYAFYAMAGDGQWNQWKIFRVSDQGTYWIGQSLNGVETTIEGDGSKYNGISGIASGTDVQVAIKLLPESSGATSTPYLIPCTTNITISAANGMQQAVTGAVPASVTINFPTGSETSELTISLTFPPAGTNEVLLASGPTYYYVSPLASDATASTSLYTRYYITSPYGSTNVAVTAMGEVQ